MRPLAIAAACFALAQPAIAQTRPPGTAQPVAPGGGVIFAETPLRIESLGLSMQVPVGSKLSTSKLGAAEVATAITDGAGEWIIRVQVSESSNKALTIEEVSDKVVADIFAPFSRGAGDGPRIVDREVKVLLRDAKLEIAGKAAARSYVRTPAPAAAPTNDPLVFGHTIVALSPGRFILFELVATEARFPRAREIYETVIATANLADPAELESSRLAAIAAGQRFIEGLTTEDYEAVLGGSKPVERWQRLYLPARTGTDADATEIAYRRVRTWVGHRGDLNPKRERARWSALDHQDGYLVRIDSRFLQEGITYDSQAIFFMTPDRDEESWSINMAVTEPGAAKPAVFTETGVRSRAIMNVETNARGVNESIMPTVPTEGYITQVEHYILPQLLARQGIPAEFGFYVFQSPSGDVRLRRDTVDRADRGWTITTQMTEDMKPQTAGYTPEGALRSITLGDGRVWEPIESRKLLQLWKQKGLPLD